jgi:hypothetical protein
VKTAVGEGLLCLLSITARAIYIYPTLRKTGESYLAFQSGLKFVLTLRDVITLNHKRVIHSRVELRSLDTVFSLLKSAAVALI